MDFSWLMQILALFQNSAILGILNFFFEIYFYISKRDIHTNFCENKFKNEYHIELKALAPNILTLYGISDVNVQFRSKLN